MTPFVLDVGKLHPLLKRQIHKYLKNTNLEEIRAADFIAAINDSYLNYERDKELFDHSTQLNDLEYTEINRQLKQEVEQRSQSFEKLVEAARTLEIPEGYHLPEFDEKNLLGLVEFLKKQIIYQKSIEDQLIQAKNSAEEATRAKSEFLSIMSHEIRTPLNAIVGLVYLMKQEPNTPVMVENLETLQFAADNLYVLINDLLDFSKIEAGKVELENTDFNFKQLIHNIQKSYQPKASEKGYTVVLEADENVPDFLVGDALRLSQVITNLVSNAIKFTAKGAVTLRYQIISVQDGFAKLELSVADTGIGIAPEHQQKIFELFTQASSVTTRKFGGTGLGLVITRRLLQLYKSDIFLESVVGEGSRFYFVIDLEISKQGIPMKEIALSDTEFSPLEGVKLLMVEDFIINIKVASKFFTRWKIDFEIAENGVLGVEKAKNNTYDLILMDIQMPEMDGYTATQMIRQFNTEIPIIALTASATISDKTKSGEVGMNDYIPKPFNPNDLFTKIAKYAGRKL
jgi:signal transduction histidine kinase/CheY-like chemotaxis protein